jgi:putative ABC transport system substrate-binding protein
LGRIEGRSVHIHYFSTGADADRIRADAAELARLAPDVILSAPSQPVVVLRKATPAIPIVFVNVPDPVALGLVASLARPGGNLTGFTSVEHELAGKWLELLKEITSADRIGVIYSPENPAWPGRLRVMQRVAPSLGVHLTPIGVRDEAEVERAFATFSRESHGGVVVLPAIFMTAHRRAIVASAQKHGLPTVYGFRFYVTSGGLASYGPDQTDPYRRAAGYIDRILKGEKPSDLPVQAPTKFELVINLKAARALSLTIPSSVLARADEVIE